MSKSTFYALKMNKFKTGFGFYKEEGSLIVINNMKFGVYQTWITKDLQKRKMWYVVELESGISIGSAETKTGAIIAARRNIDNIHPTLLVNKITEAIKRYGRSPLYQEGMNLDA